MKLVRAFPLVLLALALGCASGMGTLGGASITPDELLAGAPLGVTQGSLPAVPTAEQVLALSPEMRTFLDENVDRKGGDNLKVRQLVEAIFNSDTFALKYNEHTRSASGTFRAQRGNCLSFSLMFVAMAREVGLHAEFQEVEIPADWTLDNDTFVLNRHVNVRVNLEPTGTLFVDFNIGDFRTSYDTHTISDRRALAQYYNNLGVELMQGHDTPAAFANFRKAVAYNDRPLSAAWMNLGTLYLRHDRLAYAEAAYLQALQADTSNLVVMSNLAHLYEREGDQKQAANYRRKASHLRRHNPYYRYLLARQAFAAGDYDTAISHLRCAVRKKRKEERFYSLLGSCYQRKGNERAARRWLARAREVAASQVREDAYPVDSKVPPTHPPGM